MIYLLCGVPGSGKSWVADQVKHKFVYLSHDKHSHARLVELAVKNEIHPVLIDCPFDERRLRAQLEFAGLQVTPIFIVEPREVVTERYMKRENRCPSANILTRAETILEKVIEWKAFHGSSQQVLDHLRKI